MSVPEYYGKPERILRFERGNFHGSQKPLPIGYEPCSYRMGVVVHASKMGEKYLKRYKKYFRDPDIREFDMQHEQWLFGERRFAEPVLKAIDEFMEI